MTAEEFVQRALAVPFVEHGRGWDGWDCWGLFRRYYSDVMGVDLPSFAETYPDAGATAEGRRAAAAAILRYRGDLWRETAAPQPGDGVLLRCGRHPVHVGVYLGQRRMLHAERDVNTVVERLDGPVWAERLVGYYRHAG